MNLIRNVTARFTRNKRRAPTGVLRVVDPSPLNWLWINYNVVEEAIRVSPDGHIEPAAIERFHWVDNRTLDLTLRPGNQFADGEPLTASTVRRAFDETMRWRAPHPPGTQFNLDPRTTCDIRGDYQVRFRFPAPDGGALAKLRAMHLMSTRFWDEVGFGYARTESGEGHW